MRNSYFLITFLFICFFSATQAQAQTETILYGSVRDPDLNEKLVGVTVVVDSGSGTITDADGKYRLNVSAGTHKITFSFIGYESNVRTVKLKEGELKQLDSRLIVKHSELDVVVVSASQHKKKLAEETVSMDVINKDLIKNTNARDLGEVLGKDPGVTVQDGQVSIRGGSSFSYGVGSRTAVLVDGQSYMSADLGDAQLKFAAIENAEQVEIIKGASSVVYGSSALDGVVNLITAWPKGDKPQTEVRVYTGAYTKPVSDSLIWWKGKQPGYMGITFNHQQKVKDFAFVVGGNVDYFSGFLQGADEFRGRINFKTRYVLPKNPSISFGINGNVMRESSGRFFLSKSLLPDSAYEVKNGSDDKYIRTELTPHFTYQGDNGHRYTFRMRYLNVYRQGNGADINASSNNINIENQYQYTWKKTLVITAGVPFAIGTSRSNLYSGVRSNYAAAGYVQAEYIYKRLSVVGGVRYEINKVDTFFETTKPVFRTGVNFRAGKATFLRGSWGQGYRLPTIGERYVSSEFLQGVYIIPNPDLKAEKSWNLEVGLRQGFRIRNFNAFFDFSTFWNEFDQYVEYRIGGYSNLYPNGDQIFPGKGTFITGLKAFNVPRARVFGWEASINGQGNIGPVKITTMLGYTYSYPGNLDSDTSQRKVGTFIKNAFDYFGKQVALSDRESQKKILLLRNRHLVRGDIEVGYKRFSIGGTVYFASFPENLGDTYNLAVAILGNPQQYVTYADRHSKGDWTGDARISWQFIPDKLKFSFIVKNISNKFYMERIYKPAAPRSITVQLTLNL